MFCRLGFFHPSIRIATAGSAALLSFVPSYYPDKVIFLKAQTPDPDFPSDPKPVWRNLVQEFELYVAPGSHMTMITEHAGAVASRINDCIAKAHAETAQ